MTTTQSIEYWQNAASTLDFRTNAFIDGKFVESMSGERFDCINPANGKKMGEVASCDTLDVDAAVRSARAVFEKGSWSSTAPQHRKRVLIRFAELIEENAEELALFDTLNMGKPISQTFQTGCSVGPFPPDLMTAPNHIRWFGEAIDKIYDQVGPSAVDSIQAICPA